ncbi:DEAD/DEAH box helicase [Hansschlegelia sp.]|uniref:DEAD/DEAH box helicase n=1 Tax=Hansschlegelia sp. TaxID=2041892 RepID=UPI002CA232F6|nr:DEAD/DEAH box helicase family protein [Hansschlegelia sp.]HVI29865.1 DEAD/DEAH box helicase family protein [Hansschlegelia sp.]
MSYFSQNYSKLAFPIGTDASDGFRQAQRGALFSLGAHFSLRSEPAIVTMPTGSGKTAVLQAAAFLLCAQRVLVVTPSRLVREQIFDDFKELKVLKRLGALPADLDCPSVFNADAKITDWERLRDHDVIVATPNSASPAVVGVARPPVDFFDLILVDEAHHSPAFTWTQLLLSFPNAKRALFSATPYRRDELEIKGRLTFSYDLKHAYEDRVFGQIEFRPVDGFPDGGEDAAIAREAERKLREDQAENLAHRLMVRTDGQARAKELIALYQRSTNLKLKKVTSEHSVGHIKNIINALKSGELDGIVCVNMLGEGFDLPNLKVAAIHSPHKSLAVTLQFIGRFARTAGENLGRATFIAAPSSIKVEAEKLYAEGATWSEIVPNLSATRALREERAREILESFEGEQERDYDFDELSLYSLTPYMHVKVWRLEQDIRIDEDIELPSELNVVFSRASENFRTAVFVAREYQRVRWSDDDRLTDVRNHLFIIHLNREKGLLFVCASKRLDGTYQRLSESIAGRSLKGLSTDVLNRVLLDLEDMKLFNIGMRNRAANSTASAYLTKAGGSVERTIGVAEGQQYTRGHFFGGGVRDGVDITIGVSSASKIWQNSSARLFDLIDWMDDLAERLSSNRAVVTHSGLDLLTTTTEVNHLPAPIFAADWDKDVYLHPWSVLVQEGHRRAVPLTDFDVIVDHQRCSEHEVPVRIVGHGVDFGMIFDVRGEPYFRPVALGEPVIVERHGETTSLVDHLNERPLSFYTVELGHIRGSDYSPPPDPDQAPFDPECVEPVDFIGSNVCINTEVGNAEGGKVSVFQFIANRLIIGPAIVVFCDHGSGEIADFVEMNEDGDETFIDVFHCKSTREAAPGARVADAYEVVGQAIKSARWCDRKRIRERIEHRMRGDGVSRFHKGSHADVERLLSKPRPPVFRVTIVQPGFASGRLSPELKQLFASANLHLTYAEVKAFRVMASS